MKAVIGFILIALVLMTSGKANEVDLMWYQAVERGIITTSIGGSMNICALDTSRPWDGTPYWGFVLDVAEATTPLWNVIGTAYDLVREHSWRCYEGWCYKPDLGDTRERVSDKWNGTRDKYTVRNPGVLGGTTTDFSWRETDCILVDPRFDISHANRCDNGSTCTSGKVMGMK